MKTKFVFVFFFIISSVYILFKYEYDNKINDYLNQTINYYIIFTVFTVFTLTLTLIYKLLTSKNTINKRTNELNESKNKMMEYIRLIDENIITSSTDLKGTITDVSQAFCDISGYTKEELIGKPHNIIRHYDMPKEAFKNLWEDCNANKIWKGEVKNLKKDGGFYWVNASIYPIYDETNTKIGYTAIRQNITNQKLIEEISITDGLTNIYNRRHFNDQFIKVINSSKRNNELVCFLLMDIDHFKQYNDNYGHQAGDEVLIKFALSLKSSLNRAEDTCYRLGGEEFGIVFKSESKEKALLFANKIRTNIEQLKIIHEHNSASKYITASMGLVCHYANDIENDDIVYKESDDLMYKAKESGRNIVFQN